MKKHSKIFQKTSLVLLLSFATSAAFAGNIADEQIAGGLYLTPTVSYATGVLRVSSNTMDVTQTFNAGEAIDFANSGLDDGVYAYELTLVSASPEGDPNSASSVTQMGSFKVQNGVIAENSAVAKNAEAETERVSNLQPDTREAE